MTGEIKQDKEFFQNRRNIWVWKDSLFQNREPWNSFKAQRKKNPQKSNFTVFSGQSTTVVHQKFKLYQMGHRKGNHFHHLTFRKPIILRKSPSFLSLQNPKNTHMLRQNCSKFCRKSKTNIPRSESFEKIQTRKPKTKTRIPIWSNKREKENGP